MEKSEKKTLGTTLIAHEPNKFTISVSRFIGDNKKFTVFFPFCSLNARTSSRRHLFYWMELFRCCCTFYRCCWQHHRRWYCICTAMVGFRLVYVIAVWYRRRAAIHGRILRTVHRCALYWHWPLWKRRWCTISVPFIKGAWMEPCWLQVRF